MRTHTIHKSARDVTNSTGHLPLSPLLAPRRVTDGALNNALNAWGVAATASASGQQHPGQAALHQVVLPGTSGSGALQPPGTAGSSQGWSLASPAGSLVAAGSLASPLGGRPGSGTAGGRPGSGGGGGGSGSSSRVWSPASGQRPGGGLLPRIKTPEGGGGGGLRGGAGGGAGGGGSARSTGGLKSFKSVGFQPQQ